MSLSQIKSTSRKAAKSAAKRGLKPFIVYEEDLNEMPPFPFPFIGKHKPKGYELIQEHFVDSSGFGSESELALTLHQFKKEIKVGLAYAITKAGQFQLCVGEYKRV